MAVAEAIELFGRRQGQWDILATVEMSSGRQAGQSFVGANKVQDLPVPVEWLAGLVLGDLRKEKKRTRAPGLPFGSAGGMVGHGECSLSESAG